MSVELVAPPELGWGFKSIGRGFKKIGKGVVKVSVKSVTAPVAIAKKIPIAGSLVKLGEKLALLPLKYLIKAARTLGQTICKAPPVALETGCRAANVDPAFIPLFCTAVKENKLNLGSIKRLLPPALKVASKMAAAGMFPPIVPALAVIKRVPYVGKFVGSEGYGPDHPVVLRAMRQLEWLALADACGVVSPEDLGAMGLDTKDRAALQGVLGAAVEEAQAADKSALALGAFTVAATGLGFYLLFR